MNLPVPANDDKPNEGYDMPNEGYDMPEPEDQAMIDIVKRLQHVAAMDVRICFVAHTMDTAKEAAAEIERLRNTLKLHAGDCQSLNGEMTLFRERAEEAEAEIERLRAALQKIANNNYTMRDEMLTDSKPATKVWEAVARRALEPKP